DFELVEEKIGWMVAFTFGLESMAYLTTGLVDNGIPDYSLESAICKVSGTEFTWYAANRALQLAGGEGYMRTAPYEKLLRDIRIFPIFEGANDVMRAFIALSGIKPLGEEQGVEPSGQERYIAETFCTRAARRVERNLNQIETNDDERTTAIAKLAYKRGAYGYAFFDD